MAFATSDDVATRLGRDLTQAEVDMVDLVIEIVTGLIADAAGQTAAWAAALTPVPAYYKALCIEKAIVVGSNPNQLVSLQKQLGAYMSDKTFRPTTLFLTAEEEARILKFVPGVAVSGSARVPSLLHDVYVREGDG
jgi:hypothetical protein